MLILKFQPVSNLMVVLESSIHPNPLPDQRMDLSHCLYHTIHPHHHSFVHILSLFLGVFVKPDNKNEGFRVFGGFLVFGCLN